MNTASRPYRMTVRAEAVEGTRTRILDATRDLFMERDMADLPLADVADRAGTTVQTVLRHFDSKAGLVAALIARESGRVSADREHVPVGDVDAVAGYLTGHYSADGDQVLRLLAAEGRSEAAAEAVATGRRLHLEWVERTFAPWLEALDRKTRKRRFELLVAATDVFTWKVLCRDGGLDDKEYRLAVGELLRALEGAS